MKRTVDRGGSETLRDALIVVDPLRVLASAAVEAWINHDPSSLELALTRLSIALVSSDVRPSDCQDPAEITDDLR